ncbi:MAG: hypothetical protein HFF18_07210 [Oscillospiraceae bacterium]|nr:hypothetical protein [Oscillospiraceae bacterium]
MKRYFASPFGEIETNRPTAQNFAVPFIENRKISFSPKKWLDRGLISGLSYN